MIGMIIKIMLFMLLFYILKEGFGNAKLLLGGLFKSMTELVIKRFHIWHLKTDKRIKRLEEDAAKDEAKK